ncbi:modifier of mdg4-like [Anthonomus grandis grandis]|uniref:modifier of mdg4-like n=1 Tax=Anthonomus grandis grandis TaxID=2921223 RepID=UPI00216644EF|nr:modifier of mdg4-like [Anthonomus grandis grandis]XP_050308142.1 modifier of mdg4-like [Anthonomus grandis grandis]XP_050308143.1 modifier of mdg4-like [Anthonomus grandis grandis]
MENPAPLPSDHYKLKWNNHAANFLQILTEHQQGEYLVDVTLSCGGQYIKAHKLILAACSDYFNTIFQIHANIQHPIIFLNGVQFTDLKYILEFMYSGEVRVLDKHFSDVLALGKTLQVKGLSAVVVKDFPEDVYPKETSTTTPIQPKKPVVYKKPKLTKPATDLKPKVEEPADVLSQSSLLISNKNIIPLSAPIVEPPPKTIQNIHPCPSLPSVSSVTLPVGETYSFSQILEKPASPVVPSILSKATVIPKPPHAFMIFASEWRKKLTIENPQESTKQISVRLGNMWKTLLPETKNIYYREAKRVEEEHKRKYADLQNTQKMPVKRKADELSTTSTGNNTTLNGNNSAVSSSVSADHIEVIESQEERISISDSE